MSGAAGRVGQEGTPRVCFGEGLASLLHTSMNKHEERRGTMLESQRAAVVWKSWAK